MFLFRSVVQKLAVVDSVEREQVHVIEPQILERGLEGLQKFLRAFLRANFGLYDDLIAGEAGENTTQLHLRRAVAARRFDVVYSQLERAVDRGLEIGLVFGRGFFGRNVLPLELVAHPATGEDGHLQLGAAKAAVFHPPNLYTCTSNGANQSLNLPFFASTKRGDAERASPRPAEGGRPVNSTCAVGPWRLQARRKSLWPASRAQNSIPLVLLTHNACVIANEAESFVSEERMIAGG